MGCRLLSGFGQALTQLDVKHLAPETVYGTSSSGTDSATTNTVSTDQDTGFPRLSV